MDALKQAEAGHRVGDGVISLPSIICLHQRRGTAFFVHARRARSGHFLGFRGLQVVDRHVARSDSELRSAVSAARLRGRVFKNADAVDQLLGKQNSGWGPA